MMVVKIIYLVVAALMFLSGLLLLLRVRAVETTFKKWYLFIFIPIIAAVCVFWPIAVIAGLFGVLLGVADANEGK